MDCRRTANLRVGEWLTNHFDLIVNYCNLVFARGELIVGKQAGWRESMSLSRMKAISCAIGQKSIDPYCLVTLVPGYTAAYLSLFPVSVVHYLNSCCYWEEGILRTLRHYC